MNIRFQSAEMYSMLKCMPTKNSGRLPCLPLSPSQAFVLTYLSFYSILPTPRSQPLKYNGKKNVLFREFQSKAEGLIMEIFYTILTDSTLSACTGSITVA